MSIERLQLVTDLKSLRVKAKKVSKWKGIRTGTKLIKWVVNNDISCVGVAAPQLGLDERVFILWDQKNYAVFVNPRIIEIGAMEDEQIEGCLSLPGRQFKVVRPSTVIIKDAIRTTPLELEGLIARAWLHELDHLNGKLISDTGVEVDDDDEAEIRTIL